MTEIRTLAGRALTLGAVAYGGLAMTATGAYAAGTLAGAATVISPSTNQPLTSGGSGTTWTFQLPSQAKCSGDTATNGYNVYSYVTPVSVDPASLTFSPNGGPNQPAGSFAYPLVDTTGSPYVAKNTDPNTGQIVDFPSTAFNWSLFSIDGSTGSGVVALPAGDYNVGIACATQSGAGDKYWNGVVTFTASASDPNGEVWQVPPGNPVPESPMSVLLPTSAAAVIAGGGLLVARRRRTDQAVAGAA